MPKETPDALEELLIKKYGVAPADASAYATQILTGSGNTDHEGALVSEALGNVAKDQLGNMRKLERFPRTVEVSMAQQDPAAAGLTPEDLVNALGMIQESRANTRANAVAARQRQQDQAVQTVDQQAVSLQNAAAGLNSFAGAQRNMQAYGDPRGALIPVGQQPGQWPATNPGPAPDPHEMRLQRAYQLRKSILGY